MNIETLIKTMGNKELVHTLKKMREEKEHPEIYGKHGTTRYVTATDFWAGHHGTLKKELERRKRLGKISARAGSSLKTIIRKKLNPFRTPTMAELMRM